MFKPVIEVPQQQPAAIPENNPIVAAPAPIPESITPSPEPNASLPEGTSPISESPTPVSEPVPAPIVLKTHVSLLVTAADSLVPLTLSASLSLVSIKELLTAEAANKPEAATALKEVTLSDQGGQLVFADTLPLFLSTFTTSEMSPLFEEDFTSVVFYDANGAWFGMIAKLKEGVDISVAKGLMAKLESVADLTNLYIQDPGAPAIAGFKDGKANNLSTRYISFSKTGASLN